MTDGMSPAYRDGRISTSGNETCTGCPVCYRAVHWSSCFGKPVCLECGWAEEDGAWARPVPLDIGSFHFIQSIVWKMWQHRLIEYSYLPEQGYWEIAYIDMRKPPMQREADPPAARRSFIGR